MMRNYKLLKALSFLLALELLLSTVFPAVSYALTAGPTTPETSSFEPVDTTDIVNLASGDLAYNLPLMEVPGPAGGYPMSLSYHAGIMPGVDASWVGLGFTLNPGAINRSVSGFADDFSNVTASSRTFWEGGETTTYNVGINTGYSGFSPLSAGLVFSEDTYKGFGLGYYAHTSNTQGAGSANISYSVSPYGGSTSSAGLSIGIGNAVMSARATLAVTQSNNGPQTITPGLNINTPLTSTEMTMSSQRTSFALFPLQTPSAVYNSKSGAISTSGYNYNVIVPTPWNFLVRLGKSYQRYWSDESPNISVNGALNFPTTLSSASDFDSKAFDVYDLMDVSQPLDKSIPAQSQEGSFVDYDNYQVLAQGLSGSMRPYHYTTYLQRQNIKSGEKDVVKALPLGANKKPSFRFEGDFSNRYLHNAASDEFQVLSRSNSSDPALSFQFDPNRVTGESESDGYDAANNILPGSKHVKWFTNSEIIDGNRLDESGNPVQAPATAAKFHGFIEAKSSGFKRLDDSQIGGFKITNESGVTYHYSLPVYSFDEYSYSGRRDDKGKYYFNQSKKTAPYAYTWLLTAVTGSDFIDRNSNGFADQGDWGYWVSFNYGKWCDSYSWRNPGVGLNKDIDQSFDNFSKGKKELYYLNSISTETHTAIFVKELRLDGKGVVESMPGVVNINNDHDVLGIDNGGFSPKEKSQNNVPYTDYPASTLRLNSIILIQNKDFTSQNILDLASSSNVYFHPQANIIQVGKKTRGKDVIDIYDIQGTIGQQMLSKSVKKIEFLTDYSLSPGTDNSFSTDLDVLNTGQPADASSHGKLTLKSLKVYGKGGQVSLIPETKFSYGDDVPFYASMKANTSDGPFSYILSVTNFDDIEVELGSIVRMAQPLTPNRVSYGFVYEIVSATKQYKVKFFDGNNYLADSPIAKKFSLTKNPPYMAEQFDLWGFYKVDQIDDPSTRARYSEKNYLSENEKRMVTSISAASVDVWSLKEVSTSLGGKIKFEYESDQYHNALSNLSNAAIKNVSATSDNKTKITLYERLSDYNLAVGNTINLRFMNAVRYDVKDPELRSEVRFKCGDEEDLTHTYKWISDQWTGTIAAMDETSFVIDYNYKDRVPYNSSNCLDESTYKEKSPSPGSPTIGGTCIPFIWLDMSEPIFLGGELVWDKPTEKFGGGLRVSKVSVAQLNQTSSTLYEYQNGVTSFEPLGFAVPIRSLPDELVYSCLDADESTERANYRNYYFQDVYSKFLNLFSNARELPGPGVLYQVVKVREQIEHPTKVSHLAGHSEFEFEVFSPNTIDVGNVSNTALIQAYSTQVNRNATPVFHNGTYNQEVLGLPVDEVEIRNSTTIQDYSAIMGSLKRITYYDDQNNKISETRNQYLHDNFALFKDALRDKYKNQGVIAETFADARIIRLNKLEDTDPYFELFGMVSQKIHYPSIQIGQTNINFKTGIATVSETDAFDFYSGDPIRTHSTDQFGNLIATEVTPAYRKYPELGQGAFEGLNMLTQNAGTITYKYQLDNQNVRTITGVLSASAQTWSNQVPVLGATNEPGVWRKSAAYSFVGNSTGNLTADGLVPYGDYSEFLTWRATDPASTAWRKNASLNLYDGYSHGLEEVDLNQNYAATKMGIDQTFVYASVSNSRYDQFAYSGAEDTPKNGEFGGKVLVGPGTIVQRTNAADFTTTHTGLKALKANVGQQAFKFATSSLSDKKTFFASVWTNSLNGRIKYKLNGVTSTLVGAPSATIKAGAWYLINLSIPVGTSTSLEVWCESTSGQTTFDDFRVHPIDASVQSYVYNEWGELTHILDNNNMYTCFQYDEMGRLRKTYRETLVSGNTQTGETIYHYALQPN